MSRPANDSGLCVVEYRLTFTASDDLDDEALDLVLALARGVVDGIRAEYADNPIPGVILEIKEIES